MVSYLQGEDVNTYAAGFDDATLIRASRIIDMYLGRPEGLLYGVDFAGMPSFMLQKPSMFSITLNAPIQPGASVVVPMPSGMIAPPDWVNEAVVLDLSTSSSVNTGPAANTCENAQILSVAANGTSIVLDFVRIAHPTPTIDFGRVLDEEREMPSVRSVTRVSRNPIVRMLGGLGRYGYGRRSDQAAGGFNDFNLLAAVGTFGGPPQWEPFPPAASSFNRATGELWVPAGFLLAYYTDVRIQYIPGFVYANLDERIKVAMGMIARNIRSTASMPSNMTMMRAGNSAMQRSVKTLIDNDIQDILRPWKVQAMY